MSLRPYVLAIFGRSNHSDLPQNATRFEMVLGLDEAFSKAEQIRECGHRVTVCPVMMDES